jgi:putative transposase
LIGADDRLKALELIREAVLAGARRFKCCEVLEISLRTLQRWESGDIQDRRKGAMKSIPRKLSQQERDELVSIACSDIFRDCNPYEIVAISAENGHYYASESTFYRVLAERDMLNHRSDVSPTKVRNRPPERIATGPDQVWCWDITYLKSDVAGLFYYAYVVIDIFSRKIVGWEISNREHEDVAKNLFRRIQLKQNLRGVYLHSDNGNPMKGATMLMLLYNLGVVPSFSRPRVSDDNPFIESLFKTVKYTPGYPKCFVGLDHAGSWFADFVDWYNMKHRHSQIGYVTPEQRHDGTCKIIYGIRNRTYDLALERHPERFNGKHKIWKGPDSVCLNPLPETKKIMQGIAS